jgi:hypothetical protein
MSEYKMKNSDLEMKNLYFQKSPSFRVNHNQPGVWNGCLDNLMNYWTSSDQHGDMVAEASN